MSAATNRYMTDKVLTATPAQLVGMIFDVAIRSLEAAKSEITNNKRGSATQFVLKAQDAVTELRCALETEDNDPAVAEMAGRLDAIYSYVFLRLVKASMGKADQAIDEVHGILHGLRDAWRTSCLDAPMPVRAGVA